MSLVALVPLLLCPALALAAPLPPALAAPLAVQRWTHARSAILLDLQADGASVLIGTRFGDTQQLHLVAQPLGVRTQLTFGAAQIAAARFLPGDPNVLFFLEKSGVGEASQLVRFDRRTLKSELVTDGKSRHASLVVSREGRRLAWSGTARTGKDLDVYLAEAANPKEFKRITELDGNWRALDFAPAGQKLLLAQERSPQNVDLWLYDVGTGEKRQLTPKGARASLKTAAFSADGRAVYIVTDRWSAFNEAYRLDPARPDDKPTPLTRDLPWDVENLAVPQDPGAPVSLALSVNQDGYSRLFVVEPGTSALINIALPGAIVTGMRFAGKRSDHLGLSVESARAPRDVFVLDVRTRKFTRWTASELGPVQQSELVDPRLVRIPSAKGAVVSAFVYRPKGDAAQKHAAIVVWKNGPERQHRPGFDLLIQLLVHELDATVVLPNPRGSTGYGKAFRAADDTALAQESLADLGAALEWAKTQPDVEASRVGVLGEVGPSLVGVRTLAPLPFDDGPGLAKAGNADTSLAATLLLLREQLESR